MTVLGEKLLQNDKVFLDEPVTSSRRLAAFIGDDVTFDSISRYLSAASTYFLAGINAGVASVHLRFPLDEKSNTVAAFELLPYFTDTGVRHKLRVGKPYFEPLFRQLEDWARAEGLLLFWEAQADPTKGGAMQVWMRISANHELFTKSDNKHTRNRTHSKSV